LNGAVSPIRTVRSVARNDVPQGGGVRPRAGLRPGDAAIDATVGNSLDTLQLARLVGPTGRVLGLDIQAEAIREARSRLITAGLLDRVALVRCGHERVGRLVAKDGPFGPDQLRAVMFNLGYRPGGNPEITTRAATTIPALEAALTRLPVGGLLTIVIYRGHAGGTEESSAVFDWIRRTPRAVEVVHYEALRTRQPAPELVALAPRAD